MSGDFDIQRLYRAGGLAGAALLIEHVLCYDPDEHKKKPELVLFLSNALGVITIACAYGYAKRSVVAALEVFTVGLIGGAVVVGIRYGRYVQRIDRTVNYLAGQVIERITKAKDDDQDYAHNGRAHSRA